MCDHEFFYSERVPKEYCQCKLCREKFPLAVWNEKLTQQVGNMAKLIGILQKKVERLTERENTVTDALTERHTGIEKRLSTIEAGILDNITEDIEDVPQLKPFKQKRNR